MLLLIYVHYCVKQKNQKLKLKVDVLPIFFEQLEVLMTRLTNLRQKKYSASKVII